MESKLATCSHYFPAPPTACSPPTSPLVSQPQLYQPTVVQIVPGEVSLFYRIIRVVFIVIWLSFVCWWLYAAYKSGFFTIPSKGQPKIGEFGSHFKNIKRTGW